MPNPSEGMQKTNQLFEEEVVGKRNLAALDQIYTADARILPPGAPLIQGIEAIREFWGAAIDMLQPKNLKLTSVETMPAGDGMVEIGAVHADIVNGQLDGKYVVFWKQDNGQWKWHVDIWNLNA